LIADRFAQQIERRAALGYRLTILSVDDDPLQANIRKSILEKRFSDVLRVADAAEALCLVEQAQFAGSLGLVISAHHPAGIGGPAFVAELHTRMPSLPVLILGSSGEDRGQYSGENDWFLPKPFLAEEMLKLVGRILAQGELKTA
jgi:DNA-binding NtrC family response regulator